MTVTAPDLRRMHPADVPLAERLSAESFYDLDLRTGRPVPELRPAAHAAVWIARTEHFLRTDPGGSWVVEDDDGLVGLATSVAREGTWILSTYAVHPGQQGRGIGRSLLDAALAHGRDCPRGMLSASEDQAAVRRYRLAGFSLHPQMVLEGQLDRGTLPRVTGVRDGTPDDRELMDDVDRATRGAAHGPDHALMATTWRPLVVEPTKRSPGSGYAYLGPDGALALLAASDPRTAQALLWTALAAQGRSERDERDSGEAGDDREQAPSGQLEEPAQSVVPHVTAANQWAIDVGLAARLSLRTEGYLAVRGMAPPSPYLHHGALL